MWVMLSGNNFSYAVTEDGFLFSLRKGEKERAGMKLKGCGWLWPLTLWARP